MTEKTTQYTQYELDQLASCDTISDQKGVSPASPSQPSQDVAFPQQTDYQRRMENAEKAINELQEKAIKTGTDASLLSLDITSRLTAFWGKIAGWVMENGVLKTPKIEIDSNNERIRSTNYQTGVSGFTIQSDLVEAENIRARGSIQGASFKYDTVSAIGGQLMVTNSDVLSDDMTALDSCTLKIKGDTTFSVNDILLIRAVASSGVQEEWFRVTAVSGTTYTVTRDIKGDFSANANPSWKAGTPVVKQGVSNGTDTYSGGWLRLYGEGTNSPYYSVFGRTGVAYNAYTEVCRLGNLNGFLGYSSDSFGIAIGETSKYLKYDPTNGLRLAGDIQPLNFLIAGENLTAGEFVRVHTDGKVYKASATETTWANSTIGVVFATTDKDGSCPVQLSQVYTTSGLSAGSIYYIQDGTYSIQNTSENDNITISDISGDGDPVGQTFTTTGAVKLDWIEIYALKNGTGVTSLQFDLYATSGGLPTGGVLASTESKVPSNTSAEWVKYRFLTPVSLSASTQYAIVSNCVGGSIGNYVIWRSQSGGSTYAGGSYIHYSGSWSADTAIDMTLKTAYTTGAIGTSAGTVSKKIGIALTSTKFYILNS